MYTRIFFWTDILYLQLPCQNNSWFKWMKIQTLKYLKLNVHCLRRYLEMLHKIYNIFINFVLAKCTQTDQAFRKGES